jgi:hypothetical protein
MFNMATVLTEQEHFDEFTKYLRVRLFGLIACVDRPSRSEHFPMASGVLIEAEKHYALLTAAHFLQDVNRWKEQKRLSGLFLIVQHQSGLCNPIALDVEKTPGGISEQVDVGFMVQHPDMVAEIAKRGGRLTRRGLPDNLSAPLMAFFLVGFASAYCKLARKTIASYQEGTQTINWMLTRPGELATAISRIEFDGEGSDLGTYRFALIKGFDDYSGTSGGPIFGYSEGALARDYAFIGIQSRQIRSASGEQKPTHLIATSAPLAIRMIDEYLREKTEGSV